MFANTRNERKMTQKYTHIAHAHVYIDRDIEEEMERHASVNE